jgi:hypothetical protein
MRYPFFMPSRDGSKELRRVYRIVSRKTGFWNAYEADPDAFWRAYAEFRDLIRRESTEAWFVPAGTEWGLIGLSIIDPVDVAAPYPGVIVCRKSIAEELIRNGHRLHIYPTFIRSGQKKIREPYVELFAPPAAHKSRSIQGEMCPQCMRFDSGWHNPLPVRPESIPESSDLFRTYEAPSTIFAKETLVETLSRYNAPNLRWLPAEIA